MQSKSDEVTKNTITRANPMIWRVALWLYKEIWCLGESWGTEEHFNEQSDVFRNRYYDKAAELLKKIALNEFTTGEDNHGD